VYQLFTLPYGFDFREQRTEDANKNVRAFINRISERMRALKELVKLELPAWDANLSEDSLVLLGRWYGNHVEERSITLDERSKLAISMGKKWAFLADVGIQFTEMTLSVGLDIAVYLGECIRVRCPATRWARGGKKTCLNEPVLMGFDSGDEFSPVSTCELVAVKMSRYRRKSEEVISPPRRTLAEQINAVITTLPVTPPDKILVEIVSRWSTLKPNT